MSAYADTGFVVSLYKSESTSGRAAETMRLAEAPVPLSQLGQLEVCNAFELSVIRREINAEAAELKKALFAGDVAAGVFVIMDIPSLRLFLRSIELAERHSAVLGTRSLDLMHVAAALWLAVDAFFSFDER